MTLFKVTDYPKLMTFGAAQSCYIIAENYEIAAAKIKMLWPIHTDIYRTVIALEELGPEVVDGFTGNIS